MAVLAVISPYEARLYVIMNFVGTFSLFPLLFEDRETVVKCLFLIFNHIITIAFLERKRIANQRPLKFFEKTYLITFFPLFFFCRYLHLINETLQFLPLMIYSVFCCIGILAEFFSLYTHFMKTSVSINR